MLSILEKNKKGEKYEFINNNNDEMDNENHEELDNT